MFSIKPIVCIRIPKMREHAEYIISSILDLTKCLSEYLQNDFSAKQQLLISSFRDIRCFVMTMTGANPKLLSYRQLVKKCVVGNWSGPIPIK